MIPDELIPFTYLCPPLIVGLLFIKQYYEYAKLYRKIINPDIPLLPNEGPKLFKSAPIDYMKKFPLGPFFMWQILFENHENIVLQKAAKKTRKYFFLLVLVAIGNFILHFFAIAFHWFAWTN